MAGKVEDAARTATVAEGALSSFGAYVSTVSSESGRGASAVSIVDVVIGWEVAVPAQLLC